MKQIVLKYGTISGLCFATLLFICIPLAPRMGFDAAGMTLFLGKLAAFIPIFFAIRYQRKTLGDGFITFGKAFNTGIFVVVVGCVFYALAWIILYYWAAPDFPNQYLQDYIAQLKLQGASVKDIATVQSHFEESKKLLANPFINFAKAFSDTQLIYGIILTLIFSAILRKNSPAMKIENLG